MCDIPSPLDIAQNYACDIAQGKYLKFNLLWLSLGSKGSSVGNIPIINMIFLTGLIYQILFYTMKPKILLVNSYISKESVGHKWVSKDQTR